jgi:hypothetical protein
MLEPGCARAARWSPAHYFVSGRTGDWPGRQTRRMATHFNELVERAEIGPIPGWVVLCCGCIYNLGWVVIAVTTYRLDRRAHGSRTSAAAMG